MIVNNSQNIQSSNPLGSIPSRRVTSESRSSNIDPEDKQAQKVLQQQDELIVRQLRSRDREVRAHEGAHVAAGGSIVRGGPSYTYQTGPDGRAYAIGGEVQIDTSAVAGDPEATLLKSGLIRATALAPAKPSAQDLRVASNANQLASRARVDIAVLRREEAQLEDNQQRVAETANVSEVNADNTSVKDSGAANDAVISETAVTSPRLPIENTYLQSNSAAVAATNIFMVTPIRLPLLSQFA